MVKSQCVKVNETALALFDFDGVVVDSETQYAIFWGQIGKEFFGNPDFAMQIKGQTLDYILAQNFSAADAAHIVQRLNDFERTMRYDYIPGFLPFFEDLKRHGVKTAVVTSSNNQKMEAAFRYQPALRHMFDRILTAEMFTRSKPAPDCYLLGMETFGIATADTYVFEDSLNGLRAAKASGAHVIGLATTFPAVEVSSLANVVIPDFCEFSYEKMLQVK